jgi:penicillin-binding protein 1B
LVWIFSSIPFGKLNQYINFLPPSKDSSPIVLEEGSMVLKRDWENFHLFSRDPREFSQVLGAFQKQGSFWQEGPRVVLNQDLEIRDLMENDCGQVYCYQHRVAFSQIPSLFWKGLIGIEDKRFLDHAGVDPKSLLRALITDLKEMALVQGGSTLTQQLAKNLFFSSEKTLSRKIKEMFVALYLEYNFSKEDILNVYFNEFVWGALQGIRVKGVYAASLFYFQKRPWKITPFEVVILISLLKGPNYYHPLRNLKRLQKRANYIYKKLVELKLFPRDQKFLWTSTQWKRWVDRLERLERKKSFESIWFMLGNHTGHFHNFEKYIFKSRVNELLSNIKNRLGDYDIAVKAIIGDVLGQEKFSFYSKYERSRERALIKEPHQLGSTIKPIIYRVFFNMGKSPQDLVSTAPITLDLKSGKWTPAEAHDPPSEQVSLLYALKKSLNIPLIRQSVELGLSNMQAPLRYYLRGLKTPLEQFPAQLLGAYELSLDQLFNHYKRFIFKECEQNDEDNIIFLLSDPQSTTVSKVVGEYIKDLTFFGKTGTSNSGLDNWYVFFNGFSLGVIWVGLEGVRLEKKLPLYGSTTAFEIFQSFFRDRGKRFPELSCEVVRQERPKKASGFEEEL